MVLGDAVDFRQNFHSFSFESPHPRAMHLLGRPYRAIFVVRDPRDLIAEAYLEHLNTTEAWARLRRISAAIRSRPDCRRCPSRRASTSRSIDSPPRWAYSWASSACSAAVGWCDLSLDTRVSEFVRSLRGPSRRPGCSVVRYEDALVADRRDSNSWACGSVSTANHCATSRTRAMARGGAPRRETRRIRAPTPIARRSAARTGARNQREIGDDLAPARGESISPRRTPRGSNDRTERSSAGWDTSRRKTRAMWPPRGELKTTRRDETGTIASTNVGARLRRRARRRRGAHPRCARSRCDTPIVSPFPPRSAPRPRGSRSLVPVDEFQSVVFLERLEHLGVMRTSRARDGCVFLRGARSRVTRAKQRRHGFEFLQRGKQRGLLREICDGERGVSDDAVRRVWSGDAPDERPPRTPRAFASPPPPPPR